MNQNRIDNLIIKFIEDRISVEESVSLVKWLDKSKENQNYFNGFVGVNYLINVDKVYDERKAINKLKVLTNNQKKISTISLIKYAAVAAVALLISLPFIFNKDKTQITEPLIVDNNIKVGSDKATLTLDDGNIINLGMGETYLANNLKSNGKEIVYSPEETQTSRITYHYLTIPRGGQYFVKLSDGTQVWLNSESQLKYPVSFIEGQPRQVELVYGEAYFDVSPSTKHNGSKFKVYTDIQEIEVLGTEFNISAYEDENAIYTTLVEGKVSVKSGTFSENLIPEQQSNFNRLNKTFKISQVDIYNQISWRDGVFSFKDKPLKDIMNVLARWYDFKVVFENKDLEKDLFGGAFSKDQNLNKILNMIENSNNINFEISQKTITIK